MQLGCCSSEARLEAEQRAEKVVSAREGAGPLLERDYYARLRGSDLSPSQVMELVRRNFASLAPDGLAAFHGGKEDGIDVGDELDIRIFGAGDCRVRAVHMDAQSITLGTLEGHPEAGRITFGCYRDDEGELLFHIRSRARSESLLRLFGFVVVGEAMQTNTWTDFISRAGALAGGSVPAVHAAMRTLDDESEEDVIDRPTFLARGD
jgi:hypothetical protein